MASHSPRFNESEPRLCQGRWRLVRQGRTRTLLWKGDLGSSGEVLNRTAGVGELPTVADVDSQNIEGQEQKQVKLIVLSSTRGVLAAASDFQHTALFGLLTILAAVLTSLLAWAVAHPVSTFARWFSH